jgi:SNF2-related domain
MNRNKPGDCFMSPREEVGFLLLEECILHFDLRNIQPQTWITVSTKDRDEFNEQLIDDNDICLRGNVFLWRKEQTETELSLFLDTNHARFNGTICDAYHSSSCGGNCQEGKTSRSDASLILGLAMSCQDSDFIKIESMQIQLQSDSSQPRYSGNKMNRVSFLITFSMPWLCDQRKANLKRMSPSSKLLMALMRSDWEYLNTRMKSPTLKRFQPDGLLGSETVFPSKLSLEDLYLRIQGVQIGEKVIRSKAVKNSLFSSLPLEIIQEKIASYLRAHCLYNWQSCCYDLHQALKSVVPGLKLRLYEYQVRSLEWMRKRECQDLSEEDALNGCCDSMSADGDLHRGLTAGATVLLRTKSFPRKRIRLETEFGTVLNEGGSITATNFGKQNVTRGGLLCDDPGLGKTITVLSLILQTIGLSCESCSSSKDDKSHYNDDTVFGAYWNSLEDTTFKRHDLNRLIKQLKRFDTYGFIPQRSSKGTVSNETPQIPSCYEEIMKNIEKNKYVEDFSIFESDVYSMLQSVVSKSSTENGISECDVEAMISNYKCFIHEFKKTKIDIAKKFCSRSNDAVADMIKRNNKMELMESLYPSAATLIVVPEILLSHWVVRQKKIEQKKFPIENC